MSTNSPPEGMISVRKAAEMLGRTHQTITYAIRKGILPAVAPTKKGRGHGYWIDPLDLRRVFPPEYDGRKRPYVLQKKDIITSAQATDAELVHALDWDTTPVELTEQERDEAAALERLNRELAKTT